MSTIKWPITHRMQYCLCLRAIKRSRRDQALFATLIAEFAKPGSSFMMQLRCTEGDHAYILWAAETADNWYEFALTLLLSGKIIAQSFAAKIKPKH